MPFKPLILLTFPKMRRCLRGWRPDLGRDGHASCARHWAFLPHNPSNIGDAEADNDDGYGGQVGAGEPDILPALKERACARLQVSLIRNPVC